jgi:hypothetical protein
MLHKHRFAVLPEKLPRSRSGNTWIADRHGDFDAPSHMIRVFLSADLGRSPKKVWDRFQRPTASNHREGNRFYRPAQSS